MTRILPREEYPRLAGTEAEQVWPLLPSTAQVIVVESGNAIVGCWTLTPMLHAECLWIAPEHRKRTGVGRRLWTTLRRLTRAAGADRVWTAAMSDDVRALLENAGAKQIPGDHYVMRMENA